jgi:pyridoxamine 5'-phosphate oxidase
MYDEISPAGDTKIGELLRALPVFTGKLPVFDPQNAPEDPVALFISWLLSAIDERVPEPHSMTVSTADEQGRPSSRVLICKDVDSAGRWCFATGASSRKGLELAANPHAALNFYWPQQGRQIRIRGVVASTGPRRSAADFLARSPGARAESLTSRQSQILDDPAEVPAAIEAAKARLTAQPDLVAADWTLYALAADDVEFWQADDQRRHTRLRYERTGQAWARHMLWP